MYIWVDFKLNSNKTWGLGKRSIFLCVCEFRFNIGVQIFLAQCQHDESVTTAPHSPTPKIFRGEKENTRENNASTALRSTQSQRRGERVCPTKPETYIL